MMSSRDLVVDGCVDSIAVIIDVDPLSEVPCLKKMSPLVIIAVVLVLLWVYSPFVIVGAGERGVVFNQLHGIEDKILPEGFSFIIPFVEREIGRASCRERG